MREIDPKLDYAALVALEKRADEVQAYAEGLVICAGGCWENEPSPESLEHIRVLKLNLDEAYAALQRLCREFGIGEPQPEITTKGDPVTEVEVDALNRKD